MSERRVYEQRSRGPRGAVMTMFKPLTLRLTFVLLAGCGVADSPSDGTDDATLVSVQRIASMT
jgi:hypothetical protein